MQLRLTGLLATSLLLASASRARATNATSCTTSLKNAIGDSITVTGLLTTTDPNENGEGEDVVFEGSGGELIGATGSYFAPRTFTYTATQANETISGINVDFDNDESCNVSAIVTAQSLKFGFLTQGMRDALAAAAEAGKAVGTAAATIGLLCSKSIILGRICAVPVSETVVISSATAYVLELIAKDPSDPNFTTIAVPFVTALPPVTTGVLTSTEANAFNAWFANQETLVGYGLAAVTSFNRAQGASDAGSSSWEAAQFKAATTDLDQVITSLAAEPALLTNLETALAADPDFASFSLTPDQALLGEEFLASGLPTSTVQDLTSLGLDNAASSLIQGALFVQDINSVAGNFASKLNAQALLAAINSAVNIVGLTVNLDIKPGSGTPAVVNASSNGKLPVAILSTTTFNAPAEVAISSLTFGATGAEASLAFCDPGGTDVNGDGLPDLMCHFQTSQAAFQPSTIIATIIGQTTAGIPLNGTAAISVIH
jgi:hypothetical protein